MNCLEDVFAKRRSIYNLGNKILLKQTELEELLKQALKDVPSAFNSQSSRIVLLLNQNHTKLWNDITLNTLKTMVDEDKFEHTQKRMLSFADAYGTVLFFEDLNTIENMKNKFPEYADNFIMWANQTSAILQYMLWTLFAQNEIGASLQHYNPLIDDEVKKTFAINPNWQLIAQMPFGNILKPADTKSYLDINDRFFVYK